MKKKNKWFDYSILIFIGILIVGFILGYCIQEAGKKSKLPADVAEKWSYVIFIGMSALVVFWLIFSVVLINKSRKDKNEVEVYDDRGSISNDKELHEIYKNWETYYFKYENGYKLFNTLNKISFSITEEKKGKCILNNHENSVSKTCKITHKSIVNNYLINMDLFINGKFIYDYLEENGCGFYTAKKANGFYIFVYGFDEINFGIINVDFNNEKILELRTNSENIEIISLICLGILSAGVITAEKDELPNTSLKEYSDRNMLEYEDLEEYRFNVTRFIGAKDECSLTDLNYYCPYVITKEKSKHYVFNDNNKGIIKTHKIDYSDDIKTEANIEDVKNCPMRLYIDDKYIYDYLRENGYTFIMEETPKGYKYRINGLDGFIGYIEVGYKMPDYLVLSDEDHLEIISIFCLGLFSIKNKF